MKKVTQSVQYLISNKGFRCCLALLPTPHLPSPSLTGHVSPNWPLHILSTKKLWDNTPAVLVSVVSF